MSAGHAHASVPLAPASAGPWAEPLSDVLRAVRLSGALFFLVEARSPWTSEAPDGATLAPVILPGAQQIVSYHLVREGACWCTLVGEEPRRLEAGDVVVIPHGTAYVLSTAADAASTQRPEEVLAGFRMLARRQLPAVLVEGGSGAERVSLVCGFLGCDVLPFNPVLSALPRALVVRAVDGGDDRLRRLVELAVDEAGERRAGSDCVLLRLGELLFVEVIRRHLAALAPGETGWLAALSDGFVGRALGLLHERPEAPWTLASLAREVALSRSALAARFTLLVGEPPMQYLARWRMQCAAQLLADGAQKVATVAHAVGYESEAAFSRAFKRAVGMPPAAWRGRPAAPG